MGTAEQVLSTHGFGGDRLLKLSRRIANDELRRCGGFLDHERMEDLVGFLALHGVRAAVRYDDTRPQAKYGRDGGDPFASWMADILGNRVLDWYRAKAEGNGDRRYGNDDRIVLNGDMPYAAPADFDREVELRRREQGLDFAEAEEKLAQGLSTEARRGLALVRLQVEEGRQGGGRGSVRARKTVQRELAARVLAPKPRRKRRPISRPIVSNVVHKPPLLTIDEASARLHFSTKTVRRLIAREGLPALRPGGGRGPLRFDPEEPRVVVERATHLSKHEGSEMRPKPPPLYSGKELETVHKSRVDAPDWAAESDRKENLAPMVTHPADIALGSAQIAQKAATKVLDSLPTPDPREAPFFELVSGSTPASVFALLSPRRNRWPELQALDERIAAIDLRQHELGQELSELRQQRESADPQHQLALADWYAAGQQGVRPEPGAPELEARIAELEAEHAAQNVLRERVLEERVAFVVKRRTALVRTAEQETAKARERYLAAIAELELARDELVALNETRVWAALFPSERLASYAPSLELVGGLRRTTERYFPSARQGIHAHSVIALLRDDAEHFASACTREQAAAIQGVTTAELAGDEAMWAGSDADKAWQAREKQRLREMYAETWGVRPAEFSG